MRSHDVDYKILGTDIQVLEVELDPNETVIAEAGAMVYMSEAIAFETKMGDGSEPDQGVLTSYVEDTMKLHQFNEQLPPDIQGGGTNFLKSNALRFPRAFHGTAIVPTSGTIIQSNDHVILFLPNKRLVHEVESLFRVGVTFF